MTEPACLPTDGVSTSEADRGKTRQEKKKWKKNQNS